MQIYKDWFGKKLRELRLKAGYNTQGEFAEDMNVQTPTVSRWETGEDSPGDERLPKICALLGVHQDSFLQFPSAPTSKEFGTTFEDAILFLQRLEKAEPDIRRTVLRELGLLVKPDLQSQTDAIRPDAPAKPQSRKKDK